MPAPLRAAWFDGRSSGSRAVLLALQPAAQGAHLVLHDAASGQPLLSLQPAQVGWPERWGSRPPRVVTIDLREQGSVQVDDVGAWEAALADAGHRPHLAQRMQTRWGTLAGVLLVAAALLGAFYRWGTPWAATLLTKQVPLGWEVAVADRAMTDFDARWLKPSKLPAERQQQLRERFERLTTAIPAQLRRYGGYAPTMRLHFRSGAEANAFALPGGTIVMTDAMVETAAREKLPDEALVGVLAHEAGHVLSRHTTRMVVEQAVLNVGLGLALGDLSTVVSSGASVLTGLAYRRGHETEADCFAAGLMRHAGLPTAPMADLLLALQRQHSGGKEPVTKSSAWTDFLRSHPDTQARALALKAGTADACR